jgi:DNA-binding CsgD family transcriptional regulator
MRLLAARISSTAMIGRDDVLDALDSSLSSAADGQPRIALISGEAGIGKTRLVEALEARARELGFVVLHGESVEFGGEEFAYAPVIAALRDLPEEWTAQALREFPSEALAELAALFPRLRLDSDGGREPRPSGQARLCELVLDLLGAFAGSESALLVTVEDLHWADRSSRDLLAFMARNVRTERIAFAVTYRTGELPPEHPLRRLLGELARRPTVMRLELEPLSAGDVARQLEAIAGRPVAGAVARRLHERAGGNPFFVEELFAAHRDGAAQDVPATVAEAVLLRVRRLPRHAQQLVAIVAAAGGRISYEALELVSGNMGLGDQLRAALDSGVLLREPADRGVLLRHGLVGEVVYGTLVPGERVALHQQIAGALSATGAAAAELADQWHRAGAHEQALVASVTAGLEAGRVHAFAEARVHLERALELWHDGKPAPEAVPVDRVELLSRAAQAARFSGDVDRAVALGRLALDALDHVTEPVRAAALYERLGEYQFWDDSAALDCYAEALALLPPEAASERARLLAAQGRALMGLRRWSEARERCEAAIVAARSAGDDLQTARASITLGVVLAYLGEPATGERHLRQALETAQTLGAGEDTVRAHVHLGELLRLRGRHAAAFEMAQAGERAAARLGMRASFGHFMYVNAADDLLRLGRWDEAHERLRQAERMELGLTAAALHHAIAGQLHALRGERETARVQLEHALADVAKGLPAEFVTPVRAAWAALSLADRDPEGARRHVDAALESIGAEKDPFYTPPLHWLGLRAEADIAERARTLRRESELAAARSRADRLLADLEDILAPSGSGAIPPDGLAHRALALAERSRLEGSADAGQWLAAATAWDSLAEPYPAAYARFRQAEAMLAATGGRSVAADALGRAHATATLLAARPLLDEIEALARRARLPLARPERPRPAPAPDGAGLSDRESDVLALLAAGMTNRQIAERLFISQKTVGTHVAHIFEKLGVHTRVEAAGRARQLGVFDHSD